MSNVKDSKSDDLVGLFGVTIERSSTKRAYVADLRSVSNHEAVSFENFQTHFSPRAIEEYFEEQASKLATSTIRRRRAVLRAFFDWLTTEFGVDLTTELKVLEDTSVGFAFDLEAKRVLSNADVMAILKATQHAGNAAIRDHALIFVLYRCALRRSELASLEVESIRKHGAEAYLAIRSKRANYDARIPSEVLDAITNVTNHYEIRSGSLWRSFSPNNRGNRLSTKSIYRIVKETARRAGVGDNVTPDDLRLAGQVCLFKAGPSIQKVREYSQYASSGATMIYVHQRDRLAQSAADYINLDDKQS